MKAQCSANIDETKNLVFHPDDVAVRAPLQPDAYEREDNAALIIEEGKLDSDSEDSDSLEIELV